MSGAGGFKGYYKGWSVSAIVKTLDFLIFIFVLQKVIAEENAGWNHVILKV